MTNNGENELLHYFKAGKIGIAKLGALTDKELQALYAFARQKLATGQEQLAITLLRGLLALDDQQAAYYAALGVAQQRLGQKEEALAAYKQALLLDNKLTYLSVFINELEPNQPPTNLSKEPERTLTAIVDRSRQNKNNLPPEEPERTLTAIVDRSRQNKNNLPPEEPERTQTAIVNRRQAEKSSLPADPERTKTAIVDRHKKAADDYQEKSHGQTDTMIVRGERHG